MRTLAVVAAALTIGLVAACGGDGGNGGSATLVTAADAACLRANHEVVALPTPNGHAELVRYLGKTEAIVVGLRRRLVNLLGGARSARPYLAALRKSATVLNEMYDAARSKNPDGVGERARILARLRLGRLAARAGLHPCAAPVVPAR